MNNQYQKTIEEINSILTTDNRQLRYSNLALQNHFDKTILKLRDYGIEGFSSEFLKEIAKDNKLNVRQRINRLLKHSRVLYAQSFTYIKSNTTLLKFIYKKYGELSQNSDRELQHRLRYVYTLIDKFHLRRRGVVFRFESKFSTLK